MSRAVCKAKPNPEYELTLHLTREEAEQLADLAMTVLWGSETTPWPAALYDALVESGVKPNLWKMRVVSTPYGPNGVLESGSIEIIRPAVVG